MTKDELRGWLAQRISEIRGVAPGAINPHERFTRLGLDSLLVTRILADLSGLLGRTIPPTLAWEYPSIELLVAHLTEGATRPAPILAVGSERGRTTADEPIAIVGMACRFPGAPNIEAFWELLSEGRDAITEVPKDRWDIGEFFDDQPNVPGKMRTKWGGFLAQVDQFDPQFFGISPREAVQMDPQQRLMLELAWEALECAGIAPLSLTDGRVGVFMGAMWHDYANVPADALTSITQHTATGQDLSIVAARISYTLGLRGPSVAVNTACSSSLVALHYARRSLQLGECDMAIVGGVNLIVSPTSTVAMSKFGAMAPDGRSKAFDASANGYVRGEGGGIIILKSLSRTRADGNPIHCILRGSALNNDGASNGLTAPSPQAQALVLQEAYRDAGVDPTTVQFVETHGTGTLLGDPIEAGALGSVLGWSRNPDKPLVIGSVKTNIGHLEAAAGIAGFIKATLALKKQTIPPNLHFQTPNPHIDFDGLHLRVPTRCEPWPDAEGPALAGVSSFGFGGTNSHVVIERHDGARLLHAIAAAANEARKDVTDQRVVFVFGGQGSQWLQMGLELLDEPAFRASMHRCSEAMRDYLGRELLDVLLSRDSAWLTDTSLIQPAIFAMQVSLAVLLQAHGITPAAVVGQSMGEIAAAHVAGCLRLEDAARIICIRSQLVKRVAGKGAMAVVELPLVQTEASLGAYFERLSIAVSTSPHSTVVAGDARGIEEYTAELSARGIDCRIIKVDYASHCAQMDELLPDLGAALAKIAPQQGHLEFYSTVTTKRTSGKLLDGTYWCRNLRDPVFLADTLQRLIDDGHRTFVELDPHPLLVRAIEECLKGANVSGRAVCPMHRDQPVYTTLADVVASVPNSQKQVGSTVVSIPVTAHTPEALGERARTLGAWLEKHQDVDLVDFGYTLSLRRSHLNHRLCVVGSTKSEIIAGLDAFAAGETPSNVVAGHVGPSTPKVVFVFPGQGSQWIGMGRQLHRQEPAFRDALVACDEAICKEAGFSIIEELEKSAETSRLNETIVAQPALFALEVSLAALFKSWGVEPSAVIGHSVGEIAAAHVAGMLDLAQAARLVAIRARVMQKATGHGKMVSVSLDEQAALKAIAGLEERIGIAAVNDPKSVVLSGDIEAIDSLVEKLSREGVQTRYLRVNYAFHSPQMEPLLAEFTEALGDFSGKTGTIPMLSTVTGKPLTEGEIDVGYWGRNIRQTVRFADAIAASREHIFIEVGPHPVLGISMEQTLAANNAEGKVIPTLRREKDERSNALLAFGALHTVGVPVDWKRFYPEGGRVVALPTYPWQRKRYWVETTTKQVSGISSGHPLLGNVLEIAGVEAVFETYLSTANLAWLGDHRVFDEVVVPGAALIEMARAAAEKHLGTPYCRLTGFTIQTPLRLVENEQRRIQVHLNDTGGALELTVHSQAHQDAEASWVLHARGTIAEAHGSASERIALADLRDRLPVVSNPGDLYSDFSRRGLDYGPAFQGLVEARRGEREALSRLELSTSVQEDAHAYGIHPALLDSALQSLLYASDIPEGQVYLPFEFGDMAFFGATPSEVWAHVQIDDARQSNAETLTASLHLVDQTGRLFASCRHLRVKRAGVESMRRSREKIGSAERLYRVDWQERPISDTLSWPEGTWILLGSSSPIAEHVAQRLNAEKRPSLRLTMETLSDGITEIQSAAGAVAGILCFWDEERDEAKRDSIADMAERNPAAALCIVQAIARTRAPTRVFFVTNGAIAIEPGLQVALDQAPLWGLARVIRSEHPELSCKSIDTDGQVPNVVETLWRELSARDDETEVVWRNGKRHVPRLTRLDPSRRLEAPDAEGYALATRRKGELSNLFLEPAERRAPSPGEIEIEVHAAGLNFRDVLNALGMYPGNAGALGYECSGVVVAIGEGVDDFVVGDRVMALASGAFRTFVTIDARHAARIPHGLTMAQAASIPVVFLTAWYALYDLGQLKGGERILIHAAAGGVGMAAIQIAKQIGAQIFATASPGKWNVLHDLGIEHIANSRTLEFAHRFRDSTEGRGVDMVLNSLAGEFIDASLALLAPSGRFIEMGKTDLRDAHAIEAQYPSRRYRAFDLMDAGSDRIREMFAAVAEGFATGAFAPLPLQGFALTEAEQAFRTMAQARHIGKIVLHSITRSKIVSSTTLSDRHS